MSPRAYQRVEVSGAATPHELVESLMPFVHKTAMGLARRLPSHIRVEDLVSAGVVGLLEAVSRFDATRAERFVAYAKLRVRGAMLDDLRRGDLMTQEDRSNSHKLSAALARLESKLGRAPEEEEIAAEMGVSLEEYRDKLSGLAHVRLLSIDDDERGGDELLPADAMAQDPESACASGQLRKRIVAAIEGLPERDRLVLSLYYEEELNFREIGAVLDVTESRVCQLHTQAVHRLRAALGVEAPPKKATGAGRRPGATSKRSDAATATRTSHGGGSAGGGLGGGGFGFLAALAAEGGAA